MTGPSRRSDAITEINVLSAPVALNFDSLPGADGLSLRIYPANATQPKCPPITEGTLEILLYDGVVTSTEMATAKPLHVWSYPAEKLVRHLQTTSIGASYVMTPVWGADKPGRTRVTVFVRYLRPSGRKVYSSPAVVSVPNL